MPFIVINPDGIQSEVGFEEMMKRLKQQQYGAFTELLLSGFTKNQIKNEMDFETEKEFQEFKKEAIKFVKKTPNYFYSNKKNGITGTKTQVLSLMKKVV